MTPDPKTPAQRLARVFRILAVLAEREKYEGDARCAASVSAWIHLCDGLSQSLLDAETFAFRACRAAGIDPETIQ